MTFNQEHHTKSNQKNTKGDVPGNDKSPKPGISYPGNGDVQADAVGTEIQ